MIDVRGLEKRFRRVKAVDGVTFQVEHGETFALLGPNGSGKTTTLKCIAGLVIPTAGEVTINGIRLAREPVAAKASISYLPQRFTFPEQVTAREVLDFYRRLRHLSEDAVDAALDRCALQDAAGRLVSEFSGGMIQRLGIAVAILSDAPILLLDEPTASLDPERASDFRRFLGSLKQQGKTIVFSSHVLSDVEMLADRVAILVEGRLRAVETIASVREKLNAQSLLHVRLGNPQGRFNSVVSAAGGAAVQCSTDGLTISALPEDRNGILRALEASGAEVLSFSTVEPSLEDIYMRYIHEDAVGLPPTDRGGLCKPVAAAG